MAFSPQRYPRLCGEREQPISSRSELSASLDNHHVRNADAELRELETKRSDFLSSVTDGLGQPRKKLPHKFLYDQRGSKLFDQICTLPEYYLTRTELLILQQHVEEIIVAVGAGCILVEYGSGSSTKTRLLLDRLPQLAAYVPIDISRSHLLSACERLRAAYPRLQILPVCGDYTRRLRLPVPETRPGRRVVYFSGSTIGNFLPAAAIRFLQQTRRFIGSGGGLLIGVDLKKDPQVLHAAYNDSAGVTAEFNLNLLVRINCELQGTFDVRGFKHYAPYNPRHGRVEMHLVSTRTQRASLAGSVFQFAQGETILTECSYKYTLEEFQGLASQAGYLRKFAWTDPNKWFTLQYFVAT